MMEEERHNYKERNVRKDSRNGNTGHEEASNLSAEELFQQMRRREMEILLKAGFPDSKQQSESKSAIKSRKQSQTVKKDTSEQSQRKNPENVEEVFQQMRQKEMEILLRAGFPDTKQWSQRKSDEVRKHLKAAEDDTKQHPQNCIFGDDTTQNSQSESPGDIEEIFQQMREKEMDILRKAGFPDTKQQTRSKSVEEDIEQLYQDKLVGKDEKENSQREGTGEASRQQSQSKNVENDVEELFQQMRKREIEILLRAGFPDTKDKIKSANDDTKPKSKSADDNTKQHSQSRASGDDIKENFQDNSPRDVEELFQQMREKEMDILRKAGFPDSKQQTRSKSFEEDIEQLYQSKPVGKDEKENSQREGTGEASKQESQSKNAENDVEDLFQQMRKREIEILMRAGFPDIKDKIKSANDDTKSQSKIKTAEKDTKQHPQSRASGDDKKENFQDNSPRDVEEIFQQMREKETEILRKAGFPDTKQKTCSKRVKEDIEQLYQSKPVGKDETENSQRGGTGEASRQQSQKKNAENDVEDLFQQMRKREIEILLRAGFPDTKDKIRSADDETKPQRKSESADDDIEQHPQSRASGDDIKENFQSNSPRNVEELFQQMREKEMDILRKAGFPDTKQQSRSKSVEEDIQQRSQSKPVEKDVKGKSQSIESEEVTRQQSQSKSAATDVEELFQQMRKREIEILLRAGFPDAKEIADDDTKPQNKIKTAEKDSKQERQGISDVEAITLKAESKNAKNDKEKKDDETHGPEENEQAAHSCDVNEDESIGSFTEPMYWCCICIYRKRAHNKKRKDENNEKRPGLLKRFRRFVRRTFHIGQE